MSNMLDRVCRGICHRTCLLSRTQCKPCVVEGGSHGPCLATMGQFVLSGIDEDARAAIDALKYEDGTDEDAAIQAANSEKIDVVSFICAHDRFLDGVLK